MHVVALNLPGTVNRVSGQGDMFSGDTMRHLEKDMTSMIRWQVLTAAAFLAFAPCAGRARNVVSRARQVDGAGLADATARAGDERDGVVIGLGHRSVVVTGAPSYGCERRARRRPAATYPWRRE